jgi:predicted metal-dependent hydrolase
MDPITIGLAFTAAQSAIGHIKQAIALGKDVNSIIGQVGHFFEAADQVHLASIKAKHGAMGKTDAQIGRQALEFAMRSNQLREDERALKDMIYWQLGKPQIWEEMIAERTRLMKEKREGEEAIAKAKQAHKEKMAKYFMITMYTIAFGLVVSAFIMLGVQFYSMAEQQKEFEAAQAKALKIRREQQWAREQEQKKQIEAAAKNGA